MVEFYFLFFIELLFHLTPSIYHQALKIKEIVLKDKKGKKFSISDYF